MSKQNTLDQTPRGWYLLFAVWVIATAGTLISLFFSEVVQLPVCVLCWYQRIAMYPLVLMLPLALFPFEPKVIRYAGVLTAFGWLTALFHVLLVAGLVPEGAQPCVAGIPCSEIKFTLFGFLNIPVMSLLTFSLIGILLYYSKTQESS
ncbi:MAG: disulfide bond formation protein B [Gammaproteobacteria bacterium]|nr:disulfide bond formation protein B [Gammaproteobacteria bacterium]